MPFAGSEDDGMPSPVVRAASPSGDEIAERPRRRAVLVVEDDADLREVIADRLQDAGFAVRTARDGGEALASIEVGHPDLLLLDLMMPHVTGWDVLKVLDSRPALRTIPVLVITAAGHVGRAPVHRPVFVKPLRMDAVIRAISTLVDGGNN